ncbi:hypothetical protein M0R45_026957 [Rubus argutus]|uniref:Uncharacterized protein n=1 Tax=Rubus argutus TaxID=59490 RepID=A0AAW1X0F5_RUBAR
MVKFIRQEAEEKANEIFVSAEEDNKVYKKLIKDLIIQSLILLKEPAVLLRCREVDKKLVETVLEEEKKAYADKGINLPKITIDNHVYLPYVT